MRRIILVPLSLIAVALVPAGAADTCIPDWSIAAPIVHREGLTTVEALSRIAADKLPGSIVRTTLCQADGAFVYRLLVRDAQGRLSSRTVDARTPFGR
ncbi:MAG: hypothetical protein WDN31_12630 [Hyphomicrobium sp.]